jgi:hypothetical protein
MTGLHTFQSTVSHALGFPVFTSRLLATDRNTETITVSLNHTLQALHMNEAFQSHFTGRLLIPLLRRTHNSELCHSLPWLFLGISLYGRGMDHTENSLSVVEVCLPSRCIATVAARAPWKTSHVIAILPVHWRADCCLATSCKHSSYCCVRVSRVSIELLPGSALTCHIIIIIGQNNSSCKVV